MKKSQIALMGLTAMVMLGVWFVKSPLNKFNKPGVEPISSGDIITQSKALQSMRDVVSLERSKEVNRLEQIIASRDSSIIEKNNAISSKQQITDLTELEIITEASIVNLGYADCFVHKSSNGVEVVVLADELSSEQVIDIMNLAYINFDLDTVVVTYQSVD